MGVTAGTGILSTENPCLGGGKGLPVIHTPTKSLFYKKTVFRFVSSIIFLVESRMSKKISNLSNSIHRSLHHKVRTFCDSSDCLRALPIASCCFGVLNAAEFISR